MCPKTHRLCPWKFVLHQDKFSILNNSATVSPSSILSLISNQETGWPIHEALCPNLCPNICPKIERRYRTTLSNDATTDVSLNRQSRASIARIVVSKTGLRPAELPGALLGAIRPLPGSSRGQRSSRGYSALFPVFPGPLPGRIAKIRTSMANPFVIN